MYVKGGTTVTVVPEGNRSPIVGSDTGARVALDGTDTDGSDDGDIVILDGHLNANSVVSDVGGAVLVDANGRELFISVINETSGSDGAVHIEVVTQAIQYDTDSKTHIRRNTRRRVYLRRERKWKKGLQDTRYLYASRHKEQKWSCLSYGSPK